MSTLRIALLDQAEGGYSRGLAAALDAAGHDTRLLGERGVPAAEALLRRRGFTRGLSHVPPAVYELFRGEFDVAHAFSALDAVTALAWRRVSGRPVVFTCTETLERETLADGRLRLWTLAQAIEKTDALVAGSAGVRKAVERWFACSSTVIAADDTDAYERLYRAHRGT